MPESQAWCAPETLEVNKKENEEKQNGTRLDQLIEGEQPENDKNIKKEKKLKNLLKSKKLLAALAISASIAVILPLAVYALPPQSQGTGQVPVGMAGHLYLQGSSTVDPIIVAAAPFYNSAKGSTIIPAGDILMLDSGAGREALCNGWTDIAMASSKASTTKGSGVSPFTANSALSSESDLMTPNVIARDGVVIVVNDSVPLDVTKITMAQIVDIYMGYDTVWSQISGNSADIMKIVPRARETGSGTRQSLSDQTKNLGDQTIKTITFDAGDTDVTPPTGTENYTIVNSGFLRCIGNPGMQTAINDPNRYRPNRLCRFRL
jgi:ABC-type phosphate transport system substrate-binding protein